jgi:hypothetical protein
MPVAVDPKRWRELPQWTLEDLWLIESRGSLLPFDLDYTPGEGGFVPEIPYALMARFTKPGDFVYDPMAGMMVTHKVAMKMGRDCYSVDLIDRGPEGDDDFKHLVLADARLFQTPHKAQLIIWHPPYWTAVQFTQGEVDAKLDLSRLSWERYWDAMLDCVTNFDTILEPGRMIGIVIGDIYHDSTYLPLGSILYTYIEQHVPWRLKGWVVKDIRGNRQGKDGLWLYRAANSDSFVFRKEHILVYQKQKE